MPKYMRWLEALKEWNKGQPSWCIPRKGSKGHAEVRALMGKAGKNDAADAALMAPVRLPSKKAETLTAAQKKNAAGKAQYEFENANQIQANKIKKSRMTEEIPEREEVLEAVPLKAKTPKVELRARNELETFLDTAPEDITGVDYGQRNKEGKLQQGLIVKMLGEEAFKTAADKVLEVLGKSGPRKLLGMVFELSCVATHDPKNATDINCDKETKEKDYILMEAEKTRGKYAVELDYQKDMSIIIRLIADKFPQVLATSSQKENIRDLTKPIDVYGELPDGTQKRGIEAVLERFGGAQKVRLEHYHIKGGIHGKSKMAMRYSIYAKYPPIALRSKDAKDEQAKVMASTKTAARGIIKSLRNALQNTPALNRLAEKEGVKKVAAEAEKAENKAAGREVPIGKKNRLILKNVTEAQVRAIQQGRGLSTTAVEKATKEIMDFLRKGNHTNVSVWKLPDGKLKWEVPD